ncbi:DUF1292 domain-containing protein [Anaerobacillus sp. MEB173]|uniref:DUF1292 domain-containing protein n=1 Tax=Anaerobacillus sp. MEB173 TaxID=3383345 RepID=UPI003F93E291
MRNQDNPLRDQITVQDQSGNEFKYSVEALFDMDDQSYALLSSNNETVLMRVEDEEDEQYLIGITDENEREAILEAYQIAVEANPANDIET